MDAGMDPKKEALRRILMQMQGAGGAGGGELMGPGAGAPAVDPDGMKDGSDLAPSLPGEGAESAAGEIDEAQLMEILAALADHESGAGRSPNGLQERAAVGAKAKLQGMKKEE